MPPDVARHTCNLKSREWRQGDHLGLMDACLAPDSGRDPVSRESVEGEAVHLTSSGLSACTFMHMYTHMCKHYIQTKKQNLTPIPQKKTKTNKNVITEA